MIIFFIFIIGVSIGSFLNVLIDRIPHDESVIKGRSYCDSCRKKLLWYDLVPFFSFIFLRGKCRYCHSPISTQYPVVEGLTGLLFVFTYVFFTQQIYNLQFTIYNVIYYLFIVSSLIVIFFTDFKYGIIPDKIVYPAIVISFINIIFNLSARGGSSFGGQLSTFNFFLSALCAFGLFFFLHVATRGRGMGFGDVKLAGFMGLLLGFPKIVAALYIAFLTGAFVSLILVLIKKKKLGGDTVPFGPFLVFGALISLFYGDELIRFFVSHFSIL